MDGFTVAEPGFADDATNEEGSDCSGVGVREDSLEVPDPPFAVFAEEDDAPAAGAPCCAEDLFTAVCGGGEGGVEAAEPGFGMGVEDADGAFGVADEEVVATADGGWGGVEGEGGCRGVEEC